VIKGRSRLYTCIRMFQGSISFFQNERCDRVAFESSERGDSFEASGLVWLRRRKEWNGLRVGCMEGATR
jgi:hypothetical protein